MRLAWFSPMPPVRTGIAACSAELVDALASEHEIDVYPAPPSLKLRRGKQHSRHGFSEGEAHDFVWRNRLRPYDLTVYQLGNSSHHDYQWPYLFRYPGLVVLHDAHLHHARAAALLRTSRAADYRAEFVANHPGAGADLAELAVAGFDNHLYYHWPMRRLVMAASRMTAVHTPTLAAELQDELPDARIEAIRLGHGVAVSPVAALEARARVRAHLNISPDAIVVGVFGGLTPEKRLPQILDAFHALLPYSPGAHLLLAGATASHYDLEADLAARGLPLRHLNDGTAQGRALRHVQDGTAQGRALRHLNDGTAQGRAFRRANDGTVQGHGRVTVTGYIEDEAALTDTIAATDVALNLRWPSAREVSGPWLRALAAGVPTITLDLVHTAHVPSLDPRTWLRQGGSGPSAVTVAIDILDEDHSLRLAMRRLASDAALRAELAAAGRAYWQREHSLERMVDDYRRLLPVAAASPRPSPELPAHLVTDGGRVLHRLLEQFGLPDRNPLSGVH